MMVTLLPDSKSVLKLMKLVRNKSSAEGAITKTVHNSRFSDPIVNNHTSIMRSGRVRRVLGRWNCLRY